MQTKKKAWINLIVLIATLVVNGLGGTGLINDSSQSKVSGEFQTLITPAGFAFSIWSLIYGLLVISMIVMIVKSEDGHYRKVIEKITPLFWLSSVLNMAWIVAFSYYQIGLSTIFIFGYLLSLTRIAQILLAMHEPKRWLLPVTFGLNAGWLFIATVVNISAFLVQIEWNGFGIADTTWAILMLVISVALCAFVLWRLKNAAFPLPIAWAYFAIFSERMNAGNADIVGYVSIGGMVVLLLLGGFTYKKNNYSLFPE